MQIENIFTCSVQECSLGFVQALILLLARPFAINQQMFLACLLCTNPVPGRGTKGNDSFPFLQGIQTLTFVCLLKSLPIFCSMFQNVIKAEVQKGREACSIQVKKKNNKKTHFSLCVKLYAYGQRLQIFHLLCVRTLFSKA